MRLTGKKDDYVESQLANSATHGVGILLGLLGIPILIYYAALREDPAYLWSAIIYGTTFLMVFITSTLYHAFWHSRHKAIFEMLDHIAIYFLIAGTYTPFLMIYLNQGMGKWILYGLWIVVLIGIIFKIFFTGKYNFMSTLVYLAMGWSIVLVFRSFLALVPLSAIIWTGIGGAFYTIGAIVYLQDHVPYNHLAWHFFVLGGAVSHFVAVFYLVLT
jgi:hemolysin III